MSLEIRDATISDAEQILRIYSPYCLSSPVTFETAPPERQEMERRIAQPLPFLVAADGNHVAGYAYGAKHRLRQAYRYACEVSVYVDEPYSRRGVASQLYSELFKRLVDLGFYTALVGIVLTNPASIAFH